MFFSSTQTKPKPTWRCDVCNYETNVARNLRIHMTSEKHTHNMMVLQQNVKQLQEGLQMNPFAGGDPSTGMMNPMLAAAAAAAMGAGAGVPMDPSNPAFAEFAAYNQALFMQQLQQQQMQALQQHHMQQQLQQQREQQQQPPHASPGNSSSPGATPQRSSPGSPGASGCGGGGVDGPMDLSADLPDASGAAASSSSVGAASLLPNAGCLVASEAACSSKLLDSNLLLLSLFRFCM